MGNTVGIRRFKPYRRALHAAALITGGGIALATTGEETCVRVPAGVAALSEPAFSALKANEIQIVEGAILGWHYTIDPVTEQTGPLQELWTKLFIAAYGRKHGDLVTKDDLENTTGRMFFIRTLDPELDRKLVDWRDLEAMGYKIESTSDALVACGDSPSKG